MTYSRPVIDFNLCTGCGSCVNICPRGAIAIEEIETGSHAISDDNAGLKWKIENIEEDLIIVRNIIGEIRGR